MNYQINQYTVEKEADEILKIHYKRTVKDYFYIIVYFLISIPILSICLLITVHLFRDKVDSNTFFGALIAVCLFLTGCYFLIISVETLLKPISNVFVIDKRTAILKIKLNAFRNIEIPFSEIKNFQLGARDIETHSHHSGRTYKKQLYLIHLSICFTNNKIRSIHQFESSHLLISFTEKRKNKSLKEVGRQVADLVAKECDRKYLWTGTEKS